MQSLPVCRHLKRIRPVRQLAARGFTLPELVTVMLLLSILAAVAIPKFTTRSEFDVFGFVQQTQQSLRFAQKTAIAKRRLVCVAIASNTLTLQFASAYGASSCNQNVLDPISNASFSQAALSGVTISALSFNYDPLGRPSFSSTQTLSVTGGTLTQSVTIESETGYVH